MWVTPVVTLPADCLNIANNIIRKGRIGFDKETIAPFNPIRAYLEMSRVFALAKSFRICERHISNTFIKWLSFHKAKSSVIIRKMSITN